MTEQEVWIKATDYYVNVDYSGEGGAPRVQKAYYAGWRACEASEEYKRMKLEAERWKAYIQIKNNKL